MCPHCHIRIDQTGLLWKLRESSRRAALKLRILWGNVVLDEEVWDSAGRGSGTSREPEANVK